jgi:hypothetical protein
MRLVELTIEDLEQGIQAISLVENPAIESDFIALSKQGVEVKLATVSEEKRIVMGAALIPEKPILRIDQATDEEYYIYFTKETIRKGAEMYLMAERQKEATLEHAAAVDGVCLVESWIVEDSAKDKSAFYGMEQKPGTWMVSLKIEDDVLWEEYVKTGRVKGFSIEGFFMNEQKAELNKEDPFIAFINKLNNE